MRFLLAEELKCSEAIEKNDKKKNRRNILCHNDIYLFTRELFSVDLNFFKNLIRTEYITGNNAGKNSNDRHKEVICKPVKDVKKLAEDCKVAVRSIRRDCMEKLKKMQKNSEITEDDLKFGEKEIQDITDKFVKEADSVAAEKEKEIMEI